MTNEILDKLDSLINTIKNSNDYKRYLEISKRLEQNEEIMSLIKEIKTRQKELVKLEYNKEDISLKEQELKNLVETLEEYPIYQEFNYLQTDLNDMFQTIKFNLEFHINSKLN